MSAERICRSCGCTDTTPCIEETGQLDGIFLTTPCRWVDGMGERSLCSSCEDDAGEDAAGVELYDAYGRVIGGSQ